MKQMDAEQLKQLNTLLTRTQEFIDFFNCAEVKMIKWRHEITQQANCQQEQLNHLKVELDRMQEVISETGIECFRTVAEETVSQSNDYLHSLKNTEQGLLRLIEGHRAEITRLTQHAITKITQKTTQAVNTIDSKVSTTNTLPIVNQFIEKTVEPIEDTAEPIPKIMDKKDPHLKNTQWRLVTSTLITSLITAFIFGLYTTDEYPWEMHQRATNERSAGKILLAAWPLLTQQEKSKILYRVP